MKFLLPFARRRMGTGVVDLPAAGAPSCFATVLRSDGTSLYITRRVAQCCHLWVTVLPLKTTNAHRFSFFFVFAINKDWRWFLCFPTGISLQLSIGRRRMILTR